MRPEAALENGEEDPSAAGEAPALKGWATEKRKRICPRLQSFTRSPGDLAELPRRNRHRGLTLVELVVVLVILVALASIVIPRADTAAEQGRIDATNATLARLRESILTRYMPDTKGAAFTGTTYLGGTGDGSLNYDGLPRVGSLNMPPQLVALYLAPGLPLYTPVTHSGWNGPYIASTTAAYPGGNPSTATSRGFGTAFGNIGSPTALDAWGNPIVMVPIQDITYSGSASSAPYMYYYALISAGPSGVLGSAIASYGAPSSSSYASTQYTSTGGGSIWAVGSPIQATMTIDTAGINGNAPTGARVLTTSDGTLYPYWIPLQ